MKEQRGDLRALSACSGTEKHWGPGPEPAGGLRWLLRCPGSLGLVRRAEAAFPYGSCPALGPCQRLASPYRSHWERERA